MPALFDSALGAKGNSTRIKRIRGINTDQKAIIWFFKDTFEWLNDQAVLRTLRGMLDGSMFKPH